MKKGVVTRSPEIEKGMPKWYHYHGSRMNIEKFDIPTLTLIITGGVACLNISYIFAKRWSIRWKIVHSAEQKVEGCVYFSPDELKSAFGLSDDSGDLGDWIIEQYGADSAEKGKYIRWNRFLNIPCPGTGHGGDPNISIYIDIIIQGAIRELLDAQSGLSW